MHIRNLRRTFLAGTGGLAVALAVTSVAYGCTVFRGQAKVSNADGTSAQKYIGSQKGMSFCENTGDVVASAGAFTTVWDIKPADDGECANAAGTNQLSAGTYSVQYTPSTFHNCHTPIAPLHTMTIDSQGKGTGTFTFAGTPGRGTICVYSQRNADAIEAQVNLL